MDINSAESWDRIWKGKRGFLFKRMRRSLTNTLLKEIQGYPGSLLEAGCGTSTLLHMLDRPSTGLDFSKVACRLSQEKGVKVVMGDIHHLPFQEGGFGVVFNQSVIQTERNPVATVTEMLRVVKPGGFAVFTVPKKHSIFHLASLMKTPLWPHVNQTYWNKKEIKQLFRKWGVSVRTVWYGQLLLVAIQRSGR